MRLAFALNYPGRFKQGASDIGLATSFEEAGADRIWVGEAAGFDSPSLLGHLTATTTTAELGAGVFNPFTRSPALVAMTSLTLAELSEGRFILGLGISSPALIEGLHGIGHESAIERIDQVISVCRAAWSGEAITGGLASASGRGPLHQPVRLPTAPSRFPIPIHLAGQGNGIVELAAARAEGSAPMLVIPEKFHSVFGNALARGAARREPELPPLEISAGGVLAAVVSDQGQARVLRDQARATLAMYVGGLGGKGRNVYNRLMRRYGYVEAAATVEELYLSGRRDEAAASLPAEFVDMITVIGSKRHVVERLDAYATVGVSYLTIEPLGDPLELIKTLRPLVAAN